MIDRDHLVDYLSDYLSCNLFQDYAPNGMQIEGQKKIIQICTAVTASDAVIAQACVLQAEALIVHHGYFWRGESPVISGMKRQRIGRILASNMNLLAYHLPLDGHPDLGNNACLAELLGVNSVQMHSVGQTNNLLWTGDLPEASDASELSALIERKLKRKPLCLSTHDRPVRRLAWCSGAAQDLIEQAHQLGADAYLSGEVSERTYYQAQELGIHYYACGHHATERYGIQALGQHLSAQFDLRHQFIDSDNPV